MHPPLSGLHILLVEAKPDKALALLTALKLRGARVLRSQSLEYIQNLATMPDLVVIGTVTSGTPTRVLAALMRHRQDMRLRTLAITTDAQTVADFAKLEARTTPTADEVFSNLNEMLGQLTTAA